jgi:5-methylcytosine-specific restriction endonuclease McrA
VREVDRSRYIERREQVLAAAKERYRRNPLASAERCRRWFQENKARRYAYVSQWNAANAERVARYTANCHRNRQAQKRATGKHTTRDVNRQMAAQKRCCWWCSRKLNAKWEVDHRIPLSRGGSNGPENIVISCVPCNRRKGAKMPWQIDNPRLL